MTQLDYAGEIAAGLQDSPVWIDPAVEYTVPAAARTELLEKAEAVDLPVYVVVTAPDRDGLDLATYVHGQLGAEEGVYLVVEPTSSFVKSKIELDDAEVSRETHQRVDVGDKEAGAGGEGVSHVLGALDALADEDFEVPATGSGTGTMQAPAQHTEYVGLGAGGVYALVMVPVIAGAVLALLLTRRRRRRPVARYELPRALLRNASRLQREEMRRSLSADSLEISGRLIELDTADLPAELAGTVTHGLDAYALAGRIVDDPDATRADLAGALVLLRTAAHDIATVEERGGRGALAGGRRRTEDPARLCVVDPGHGRSTDEAEVPVTSGALRSSATGDRETDEGSSSGAGSPRFRAPVCADCAAALGQGREPEWLLEKGVPYVERDTVWARTLFGVAGGDLVDLIRTDRAERESRAGS